MAFPEQLGAVATCTVHEHDPGQAIRAERIDQMTLDPLRPTSELDVVHDDRASLLDHPAVNEVERGRTVIPEGKPGARAGRGRWWS